MIELKSKEDFFIFVSSNKPVLVVFSTHDCTTCKPVKEKVVNRFDGFINTANIYLDCLKELAGELSIFNVPVVAIFFEGREVYRFVRVFSIDEIEKKLNRILEFL